MQKDALRATFFEECEDLLSSLGDGLGRMDAPSATIDMEIVHGVFRAVHSIKGGAGAFGLTALVEFAHAFETVLDLMRSGRMQATPGLVQILLRASDVLADLVAAARDGGPNPAQMNALLSELDLLAETGPSGEPEVFDFQPLPIDLPADPAGQTTDAASIVSIDFVPTPGLYAQGHEPAALIRDLARLGQLTVHARLDDIPPLSRLGLAQPTLSWNLRLRGPVTEAEITEVFEFVGALAQVTIRVLANDPAPAVLPEASPQPTEPRPPEQVTGGADQAGNVVPLAATIRVNLDRVDRLINQIGELVIMEAMLAQAAATAGLRDDGDFVSSLNGIKQLAAGIQESVMAIRAQPLKPVFQRMERILREACDATGKQVRLAVQGEATEVDRTVIERLVDPLTHMIRNSVDHGIEAPDRRIAMGKPPTGVITLSAAHRSGRVIIEVSDDGGGIDRARVRDIGEARGLVPPGAQLSAAEIDNLLFMPGFSSKETVSALSGRGVGLDVVRREIQSLGGRVMIQSAPMEGTTFTIALPLTLAILDGMLISVGSETMILPLSSIMETIRPNPEQVHMLGRSGRVVANRGELLPVIDLAQVFGFAPTAGQDRGVLIMVECDAGRRAALVADSIHDQRQVVIKSLENNYGSVHGISAATILGDGRIALIIDPEEIMRTARPGLMPVTMPLPSMTAQG